METINQQIELLVEDLKRVTSLLNDAASDAELLDSQPYQQARLLALRQQLFDVDLRLQNLRRELTKENLLVPQSTQRAEEYQLNIA